ncbi:MAG: hypothetical protein OEQ24_10355 [Gammaproteobacteria bacterium]|nr:hypothetical protein [Gammaproteobacteria bacterium]
MANGFQGSPQEWKRITEPLEQLDAKIAAFVNEKRLPLQHNNRSWPNREIRWLYQIERLIEIYLEDDKEMTWTLWICAYDYANSVRLRKQETIHKAVSIDVLNEQLEASLALAYEKVCSWNKGMLSDVGL